jgi:hypothetical protein
VIVPNIECLLDTLLLRFLVKSAELLGRDQTVVERLHVEFVAYFYGQLIGPKMLKISK